MRSAVRHCLPLFLSLTLLCGCQPGTQTENTRRLIETARQSGLPTLVEFGATTCRTCRELKPVLESTALRLQGQAHVIAVDLSQDYSLSSDYQIRMMPTIVFYDRQGHESGRHIGAMTQAEMISGLRLDSPH